LVYLANPNNITGTEYSRWELEYILKHIHPVILLVDESSFEYNRITVVDLIEHYDNLIVLRDFPGLPDIQSSRKSYILGDPEILKFFVRKGLPACTDLDDAAAAAGLRSVAIIGRQRRRISENSLFLSTRLRSFGFKCTSTPAGRLIVRLNKADEAVKQLHRAGIEVENLSNRPRMDGYISIMSNSDNDNSQIINTFRTLSAGRDRFERRREKITLSGSVRSRRQSRKSQKALIYQR
jgi:histidinol-phosphate aminotransferase